MRLVLPLALFASVALLPTPAAAEAPPVDLPPVNSQPVVVPALQTWSGGTGAFELPVRPRVSADRELSALADQLAGELTEITGRPANAAGRHGDIELDLDPALSDAAGGKRFAEEGYRLEVNRRGVKISAPTAKGVFYGTRSILQILARDTDRSSIPAGTSVDWPNYPVRGFMLDVGRRYFTPEFIRDYLRMMGWYKLNELQIHLNDNEIKAPGGDWSKAQSAFRLATDNLAFAGLAAKDGSYDRAAWDSFEDTAAANAVTLIPEIDAPGHARSFIAFKPELGLNGGNSDHLDLSKPESTAFMKSVFDEFTPWFRSKDVHYGTDEYTADRQLYKKFFNDMAAHLRSLGKHPRAWGSATAMTGTADGYDRDVTINSWNNGWYGPDAAVKDGYQFINTNDALLYIVPFADYYHGNGLSGQWLYENWEPHVFPGGKSVTPGEPLLRGAMSAVWNDLVRTSYTEHDVHRLVEPTFGLLGQKMWSGAKSGVPYSAFMKQLREVAPGPSLTTIRGTMGAPDPDEHSFGKPVTASSGTPAKAVDGVRLSRWQADRHDRRPWIQVDLGKPLPVHRVEFDIAEGRHQRVRVSDDGGTWRAFDGPTTARYVRVEGLSSLWSLKVFDAPDLARGKPTTASSSEVDYLGPANATDGDPKTRWASAYRDAEWLQVDLGAAQQISRVLLDWEEARGKDYDVQVSDDGAAWQTVAAVRDKAGAGVDEPSFAPVAARYVRMQGIKRATTYGYSVFRFEIR
ncbi:discoidin domain-containing protein [Nonomuraea sp. NPDC059194]|uniref:discoidin domain-containing protein n=1 Tax=Nonomuraea sp. NPDC059194 TaxID=3346764 RepID=UPI00369F9411